MSFFKRKAYKEGKQEVKNYEKKRESGFAGNSNDDSCNTTYDMDYKDDANMKFEQVMAKAFYYISIIIGIIMIIALVYKILGHSPTVAEITLGLQMLTITGVLSLTYHFGVFKGKAEQFMKNNNSELKELQREIEKTSEKLNSHLTQSA